MVSTRTVVIGGLACVAVAGAATLAWRYGIARPESPKSTKSKPRRKKQSAAKAAAGEQAPVEIPPESELINRLLVSMERMQSTGTATGPNEAQLVEIVTAAASSPDRVSVRCRLMAAQWTILHQTLVSVAASSPESIDIAAHEAAMKRAWDLLALPLAGLSADERSAVDILQLDVSQRLRSPALMIPVYERLLRRMSSSSLSNEETLVLFTSSPMLGRWDDTRRIGGMILAQQESLDEFHQAALQRPELPDYSVLYEHAVARKSDDQTSIAWAAYAIQALRIRLRDVHSTDAAKAAEVRAVITDGWQTTPRAPDARLFRHGAIGQMLSASEVKISCVGPWDGNRVDLKGWADLQKGPDPASGQVRQTERYEFGCEGTEPADGIWSGTYTLSQQERDSTITVVFDLELDLQLDAALSPPTSTSNPV